MRNIPVRQKVNLNPVKPPGNVSFCTDLCLRDVLICDDEAFNLVTLSAMLSDLGITSECFESGAQAVNCYRKRLSMTCCSRSFRLVLTDISMPQMDGFEVCTQIIKTQKFWFDSMLKSKSILKFKAIRETPVVAVTAYTDQTTTQTAMAVGMSNLLHKPVSHELLKKCLADYFYR